MRKKSKLLLCANYTKKQVMTWRPAANWFRSVIFSLRLV